MAFIFGGNTGTSYEDMMRKRDVATQMAANIGQGGYAALGAGLTAGLLNRQANRMEREGKAQANQGRDSVLGQIFGQRLSGSSMSQPASGGMVRGGGGYRDAIASIESAGSGDYAAVGPTNSKLGRALGRYQIMEANIGPWSREALGREVSADEFMANPQLQDAIFDHQFGKYVNQYGEEGAAQAWFGGPGGVGQTGRKDVLGTTIGEYGQKFTRALGRDGGPVVSTQGQPQAPGQGMDMAEVARVMSDPYLDEGSRGVLAGIFQQNLTRQQQMADPSYQMGLERDRIGLQQAQMELQRAQQPGDPAELVERRALAAEAGLQPGTPEYQAYIATGSLPKPQGGSEFGLNPIYGRDANGNVVVMQLGKDGAAISTKLPEGVVADLGVQSQERSRGTELGKQTASAQMGLPDVLARADGAVKLIDSISSDQNLSSITGSIQGGVFAPGIPGITGGQAGKDLAVKIDQLKGQTFLQAFEGLKGAGQITEVEGAKAEAAIARLNMAQSKAAFKAALADLRSVVSGAADRARGKAVGAPAASAGWTDVGGVKIRRKE